MGSLMKALTGILGILAILACLTTIGVIGYALLGGGKGTAQVVDDFENPMAQVTMAPVPTVIPESSGDVQIRPISLLGHTHDYKESVDIKATCYQAGRLKYTCEECGDVYYVDVLSAGHVADDEWEIIREASADSDGLRVRRCIYCDEVVAEEVIPYVRKPDSGGEPHVHEYIATVEREPSCILSGLRKYTCSCGSFYTEQISAPGHVATDWTTAEEATATKLGREQRTCTVCGVILDSRPIPVKEASPSPSSSSQSSASATAAATATSASTASPGASASAGASASPSTTPHTHEYTSYILKEANCTEKGIRSFVCVCGSTYAETIDLDLNQHSYIMTVIPATSISPGYTLYRCKRCNYTYMDNYT